MALKVKTPKEKESELQKAAKLLAEEKKKRGEKALIELEDAIKKIEQKHNCVLSISLNGAFADGSLTWKHVAGLK